jgi:C4-type Zn-finger protein
VNVDLADFDLHCPFCFGKIIRAKHSAETPHKGDFAFCSACGNVGVFTDRTMDRRAWAVRKPTAAERAAISQHATVNAFRQKWTRGLH